MAISYVGAATFGSLAGNITTFTQAVPSGVADGDLLLWDVSSSSPSATIPVVPSGWALWRSQSVGTSALLTQIVWYRFASSEPASYTLSGLSTGRWASNMTAYRGVDTTTPKDVAETVAASSSTEVVPSAITPATAGAWVVTHKSVNSAAGVTSTTYTSSNLSAVVGQASSAATAAVNAAIASGYLSSWSSGSFTPDLDAPGTIVRSLSITSALRPAATGTTYSITASGTGQSAGSAAIDAGLLPLVTYGAMSSVVAGDNSCAPTYPTNASGDGFFLVAYYANPSQLAPLAPAGWTKIGDGYGGLNTYGANSGPRGVAFYQRNTDSAGGETGSVTLAAASSGGSVGGFIFTATKNLPYWSASYSYAADAPYDSDWNVPITPSIQGQNGDLAVVGTAITPDTSGRLTPVTMLWGGVFLAASSRFGLAAVSSFGTYGQLTTAPVKGSTSGNMTISYGLTDVGTGMSGMLLIRAVANTTLPLTASGTGASTGSAALTAVLNVVTYAVTAAGTGTSTGAATLTAATTLTATGTGQSTGAAAITIAPRTYAVTTAGTGQSVGSAALTIAPRTYALTATGTGQSVGTATLTAATNVTATGTGTSTGTATLTAATSLAGTGAGATAGAAAFTLTAALTATGTGATTGAAAITRDARTYTLTAAGTGASTGAASIGTLTALTATGTGTTTGAATLTRATSFTASGTGTTSGSASLGSATGFSSVGSGTTTGSAALILNAVLSAAGSAATAGAATLTRQTWVAATGAGVSTGTATLSAGTVLTATGSSTTTGSAAIGIDVGAVTYPITATGTGTTTGSATITVPPKTLTLTAAGSGITSGVAMLGGGTPLTATGGGTTAGSAALTVQTTLTANGTSATSGTATPLIPTKTVELTATGASTSDGAAFLATTQTLTAAGASQLAGQAALATLLGLSANGSSQTNGAATVAVYQQSTTTPAVRTQVVPAESRLLIIDAETRMTVVDRDPRNVTVEADPRAVLIPADNRTLEVAP